MTNREKILQFLRDIAPDKASNSEIVGRTGVTPHQQVFQITQYLMKNRFVLGQKNGHEWRFWYDESQCLESPKNSVLGPSPIDVRSSVGQSVHKNARKFEELARNVMGNFYGCEFSPGTIDPIPKVFDLVSEDLRHIGDAKLYSLVRGSQLPPAKFSVIAEHVWLLEKTRAPHVFIIFGNDRRVPELWLQRYGHLVGGVRMFFLSQDGALDELTE